MVGLVHRNYGGHFSMVLAYYVVMMLTQGIAARSEWFIDAAISYATF